MALLLRLLALAVVMQGGRPGQRARAHACAAPRARGLALCCRRSIRSHCRPVRGSSECWKQQRLQLLPAGGGDTCMVGPRRRRCSAPHPQFHPLWIAKRTNSPGCTPASTPARPNSACPARSPAAGIEAAVPPRCDVRAAAWRAAVAHALLPSPGTPAWALTGCLPAGAGVAGLPAASSLGCCPPALLVATPSRSVRPHPQRSPHTPPRPRPPRAASPAGPCTWTWRLAP